MAYFNHAFNKVFLGTGTTRAAGQASPTNPHSTGGFITTADTTSETISTLGPGYFAFVDPDNYQVQTLSDLATRPCCPLVLVSSSILSKDKIGPYHGGYLETNKSKKINPKYIHRVYRVNPCVPKQAVVSVGNTPGTSAGGLDPDKFQGGTTESGCCFTFLCGETYYLRIDVKGSPALRFLNHQAYQTLDAYTGCCPTDSATAVDSTTVMISWAMKIVVNPYLKDLIFPVVFDESGVAWYPPGTTTTLDGSGDPVIEAQWWTNYPETAHVDGQCAGLRLYGAYVDTKFGDCTFQVTDFFEKEPVKILASMVDLTGDPCTFEGICVYTECFGNQGMGYGEQVLRDLIVSESYLQNYLGSGVDFRIREITQGYDIIGAIDRSALYTRYYIQHSIPRWNNPTGVFDNDQYLLEIIVNEPNPATPVGNSALETFLFDGSNGWLKKCHDCQQALITEGCEDDCTVVPDTPAS